MSPLKGVHFLQGDFLDPAIQAQVAALASAAESAESVSMSTLTGLEPGSMAAAALDAEADEETAPTARAHDPAGLGIDAVLSDMMTNISGVRTRDVENSLQLCEAALRFAVGALRRGGVGRDGRRRSGGALVCVGVSQRAGARGAHWRPTHRLKHFQHPLLSEFKAAELDTRFHRVWFEKPKESRKGGQGAVLKNPRAVEGER